MKILLHCGVGNHDRPSRWWGVCVILSNLARSLEALGHECLMYCHPDARADSIYKNHTLSREVDVRELASIDDCFAPDVVITWNGASEGDQLIVDYFGRSKCVFGELGFFDHYETVYFDFSGTNCKSMNLVEPLPCAVDSTGYWRLRAKYNEKPARPKGEKYVFVAMQDESDTNITQWSPFSTMNDLLAWVCDVTTGLSKDLKILYKKHPKAPCNITIEDPRLEEVFGNVHAYMPDAQWVFGCNSTVLFECLLYHERVITAGLGLSSRPFKSDAQRHAYVVNCHNKQIHQTHLANPDHISKTWFYQQLVSRFA